MTTTYWAASRRIRTIPEACAALRDAMRYPRVVAERERRAWYPIAVALTICAALATVALILAGVK